MRVSISRWMRVTRSCPGSGHVHRCRARWIRIRPTIDWGDGTAADVGWSRGAVGPPGSTTPASGRSRVAMCMPMTGVYTVTVTVTDDDGGVACRHVDGDGHQCGAGDSMPVPIRRSMRATRSPRSAPRSPMPAPSTPIRRRSIGVTGPRLEVGVVAETPIGSSGFDDAGSGTVSGSHVYADDGIYTVTVTVTDDDGGSMPTP